ncbi:MAG: hypothetical protein GF334_09980 [Candidatus Altiarchaeales archaeon]|nr:hypothetical protein [Candidatus Altiarchaeales archaeon]
MTKKILFIILLSLMVHAQTTSTTQPDFEAYIPIPPTTITQKTVEAVQEPQPTTSTTQPVCGGSETVCNVEFKPLNNAPPVCCNEGNHEICSRCLPFCKKICGQKNLGVETCFPGSPNPTCLCSTHPPTCYQMDNIQSTSTTQKPPQTGGNSLGRFLFFMVMFALIIGLILYVRRI